LPFQYSTIVKKIDGMRNEVNMELIQEFLEYLKNNHSSENHQINNLKCMISLAGWLDETSFYEIKAKAQIISFLDTKVKNKNEDPEQKWITTWNNYLNRIR
jgi:integrase/recombinase XerD